MLVGLDTQNRTFFRLPVELKVRYLFVPDGSTPNKDVELREGVTENLSGGGMLLRTSEPPLDLVGDLLSGRMGLAMTFDLPDGTLVRSLCRVAWVEGVGQGEEIRMGIKFHEIKGVTRDQVIDFVVDSFLP